MLGPVRWAATLLDVATRMRGLLETQEKTSMILARQAEEIQALRLEIERLKAREEFLISEARVAASGAATTVVAGSIADLARRVGRVEAQKGVPAARD